jgi:hypothetical protein
MNVTLREARFTDASRNSRRFESFFVQNRLVRAVQIPAQIDVARELDRMFDPAARGEQRFGHVGFSVQKRRTQKGTLINQLPISP